MAHPDQLPSLPDQPPQGGAVAIRRPGALSTELLQRGPDPEGQGDDEIDLKAILRTLLKHKWMIAGVTGLSLLAAIVYTLRVTPQYESKVLLQIDRTAQKVVGFNNEVEVDQGGNADQLQLRTQIELLKSRALSERVIDELGLYKKSTSEDDPLRPATAAAEPSDAMEPGTKAAKPGFVDLLANNLKQLFTPSSKDEQALTRADTLKEFDKAVAVEPVRNSRLVEIKVLNSDPELSARIANTLAKTFIASNIERKADSSVYARQFLEDQIRQTKAKLEESERVINEYAKKNEILNLGDKGSATTQTFVDFSSALAKAEQDRIKAESLYNQLKDNPQNAPQALENDAIQRYKEQKATLEAAYAKSLEVYKPDFPAMLQAKAQINELDAKIKGEINTILGSIKAQYEAAKAQEASLKARVASSRSEVLSVQDRSVDMNLLKRELDTNRQVYDSLLQRLKEVSVTAGITTNNVSIVDEASAPLFPAKPKPLINLGLGLVLGVFLGMLAALLREQMDDSLKHADEVEKQLSLPLLGLIPMVKPDKGMDESVAMLAHLDPRSAFSEAYRSMRTALQFSTTEGAPKRFMVTSCGKAEGKSTTALALAINFAQLGQRVLLIDADMRRPSVHKALKASNDRGLSNLLTGDMPSGELLIQPTVVPNLSVLMAGPTPPDPVELLMGPKFGLLLEKAAELGFTQIVIDGPPLLGIADAIVLGNQIQHIVFAIKAGSTRKASIKDALRRLRHAGLVPMGVALTHARSEHTSDYGYEAYYGYGNEAAPVARPSLPAAQASMREPSLGKAEGPGVGSAAASGPAMHAGTSSLDKMWTPPLDRPGLPRWALPAGIGGALALAIGAVWWTSSSGEPPAARVATGTVAQAPAAAPAPAPEPMNTAVATASAAPAAPTALETAPAAAAAAVAPVVEPPLPAVAPAPAAAAQPDDAGPPPALASLKDQPADTWPMLAELWGTRFEPVGACDNVIAAGLQCFRMPAAKLSDLQQLDRPGLVQLKDGKTERWVLLSRLDDQTATLRSGALTWRQALPVFERQWTGAYTTVWRLPPGTKERVFAAKANDPAGRWLDAQLIKMPDAKGEDFSARVKAFQQKHGLPDDGKAMPVTFVLVNRLVNRDEPHLR